MKSQPRPNPPDADLVETPIALAVAIVDYFHPAGAVCDPAAGLGEAFATALRAQPSVRSVDVFELRRGTDFLASHDDRRYDWIVTNPPWSKFRTFLAKGLAVADRCVYLVTVNHCWTKARVRIWRDAGFGLATILLVDAPDAFPATGFQLGAVEWRRGYGGPCAIVEFPNDWSSARV